MSDDELVSITYSQPSAVAAEFQDVRVSEAPFEETLWRLRDAIEAAEFWIVQEIDPQMLLKRGGLVILSIRQLLFFHPSFMARILKADPAAALEAPLKIVVLELPSGAVQLRWIDPAPAFERYGSLELSRLGHELSAACKSIASMSVQQNGAVPR